MIPRGRASASLLRSLRLGREIGSELDFDVRSIFRSPRNSLEEIFPHHGASLSLWASGRAAIGGALRAMTKAGRKPLRFLLPSYLCPAVLQPFQNLNVAYDFYPLDDHLLTDWDEVRRSIWSQKYDGLLFISYFGATGRSVPPENLFLNADNSFVIEDLAQAMLSPGAGQRGDYVVYSPRKFFALPDGGALVARKNVPGSSPSEATDGFFGLRLLAFYLREQFRSRGLGSRNTYLSAFKKAEEYLDTSAGAPAMSDFSLGLLKQQDLRAARCRRRKNFAFLGEHWPRRRKVVPLELSWQTSDVPSGFPVWAPRRDAFRRALIQHGIFPPIHWRLPEAVLRDKRFRASWELSEHILTIPCDQRYDHRDMAAVIRAVCEVLN